MRRFAEREPAINFRRRENSVFAGRAGSSTGGSRGHHVRDAIGSPLSPTVVWARARAHPRESLPERFSCADLAPRSSRGNRENNSAEMGEVMSGDNLLDFKARLNLHCIIQ